MKQEKGIFKSYIDQQNLNARFRTGIVVSDSLFHTTITVVNCVVN